MRTHTQAQLERGGETDRETQKEATYCLMTAHPFVRLTLEEVT